MINLASIQNIIINPEDSILKAIRMMDDSEKKLLIVVENEKFKGLLSIGDIQRSLIKNQEFTISVGEILRKEITVAYDSQAVEEVKNNMLLHRTEFMPVLDNQSNLVDVLYWDDMFDENRIIKSEEIDVPVVIMAGGKGTRLKPLTNIIPKPLIPFGDNTILELIISSFKDLGSSNFFLSVNYKADMIKRYLLERDNLDVNIDYFIEKKPLGTAGSLHLVSGKISTTFFVSNCDILIDQDYHEILNYHNENNNEITLVSAIKNFKIPYGTIEAGKGGLLKSLKEKPMLTYYVNAGMYILEPHLLKEIPQDEFFHITDLIEKVMARNGRVGVFPVSEGAWSDVGEWNTYKLSLKKFGIQSWW